MFFGQNILGALHDPRALIVTFCCTSVPHWGRGHFQTISKLPNRRTPLHHSRQAFFKGGLPVEELDTEDSTEFATPPDVGREASVPLKTAYDADTVLVAGVYTGLHGKQYLKKGTAVSPLH